MLWSACKDQSASLSPLAYHSHDVKRSHSERLFYASSSGHYLYIMFTVADSGENALL